MRFVFLKGVTVLFATLFFQTYVDRSGCLFTWWMGIGVDFVFYKKKVENFQAQVKALPWAPPCSSSPVGFQQIEMTTNSHGKPGLQN